MLVPQVYYGFKWSLALGANGILELIFIAWTLANFILKLKYALLLFTKFEIEIAVKSRWTVRRLI